MSEDLMEADLKHSEVSIHPVPEAFKEGANIDANTYNAWYQESIQAPTAFWQARAKETLDWIAPWEKIYSGDMAKGETTWFEGAKLNVTLNCIDRHLPARAQQTAIIWEGDDPNNSQHITYQELHDHVCRFANALKARNIKKGDRVCIYMPMIPEAAYAMLACARIGAIHSVVFGGFSPDSLKKRILDADCQTIITADEGVRGNKTIPLKKNTDAALQDCPNVHSVFVIQRTGNPTEWNDKRDIWYHEAIEDTATTCEPEVMDAEDPLFILYTSGSTGTPKGVLHTTAGYLLQAALTHKYVLDYREGDIYWCTADVGWITGHSYIVYGPLANGATTLMFEGVPNYPTAARCWEIVDKHQVNIFYTAPTAIRALMAVGDEPVKLCKRTSLRLLGTVGEPINPEAWEWYHSVVGDSRCPIVDTWWQTETGAIMLAPIPGITPLKPGCATKPFFGVKPALVDKQGNTIHGPGEGNLIMEISWPSQIRSVYGNHQRCIDTYFAAYPGKYFTGDGARRDEEGDYWITGRVDDVLNVSGHRLGTAEIESALVLHPAVAEAAIVGYPHDIKGEAIYAYVTPMHDAHPNDELKADLIKQVSKEIGPIAKPDHIQWASALPKTRSGKIMRRILRKIAANKIEDLGDTSTLADPSVVEDLIANKKG